MFAPAYPHDPIQEIYPNIFLIHGSIKMGPGLWLNRNMLILKQDTELTLVNPVRLSLEGFKELDQLGDVTNIIRLGDFHGLDDPFYLDRYDAKFWCQEGQGTYPEPKPDIVIDSDTASPIAESQFFLFETALFPEAALFFPQHKLLITTDAIQYYSDWSYTSFLTKIAFKLMGFKLGMNIGGPWIKRVTPKGKTMVSDFESLLQLDFDAVIAAHGTLIKENAKSLVQIEMQNRFEDLTIASWQKS